MVLESAGLSSICISSKLLENLYDLPLSLMLNSGSDFYSSNGSYVSWMGTSANVFIPSFIEFFIKSVILFKYSLIMS